MHILSCKKMFYLKRSHYPRIARLITTEKSAISIRELYSLYLMKILFNWENKRPVYHVSHSVRSKNKKYTKVYSWLIVRGR